MRNEYETSKKDYPYYVPKRYSNPKFFPLVKSKRYFFN